MYIFSYSTPFSFFLIFVVGFYFLYKLIFSYFVPGIKNLWIKHNKKYIALSNDYQLYHHMFFNPEDLDPPAKSREDPRYKKAVRQQTFDICKKIKRGEISVEEIQRYREELYPWTYKKS